MNPADPHAGTPVRSAGPPPEDAPLTLIMIHGRGASADDILGLYRPLRLPQIAALAPEAAGNTWYPFSFLSKTAENEPKLSSALRRIGALVDDLASRGVGPGRVALLGFSQGACLASEFVARNPRRYAGVMIFTGGLIGPPGTEFAHSGDLAGTPVFMGVNDPDPHVPFSRAQDTADLLTRLGGDVTLRRYPGEPHAVNMDEIAAARDLLSAAADLAGGHPPPPPRPGEAAR